MDARTTACCEGHEGNRYKWGEADAIIPPNHHQCRSVLRPVWWFEAEKTKWDDLGNDLDDVPARFGGTKEAA